MIRGLLDGFRQGRDEALAEARRRRIFPEPHPREPEPQADEPDYEEPADYRDEPETHEEPRQPAEDFSAELRACEADRDEKARLLAEVTDYAAQLQARVEELEAAAMPLVKVFRLPGLKAMLMNRYHPDKHPGADPDLLAVFTEAVTTINEGFAVAEKIQASG